MINKKKDSKNQKEFDMLNLLFFIGLILLFLWLLGFLIAPFGGAFIHILLVIAIIIFIIWLVQRVRARRWANLKKQDWFYCKNPSSLNLD